MRVLVLGFAALGALASPRPTHEIGHLVFKGEAACWFWSVEQCSRFSHIQIPLFLSPDLNRKSSQTLSLSRSKAFKNQEIRYEESGYAVFETQEGNWFRIESELGEPFWLHRPTLGQKVETEYLPLESTFARGVGVAEPGARLLLRKSDLITPEILSPNIIEAVQAHVLEKIPYEIPIGFISVTTPCITKQLDPQSTQSSCSPPPKANVFSSPSSTSQLILNASLNVGHLVGETKGEISSQISTTQLLVFGESDGWLKIRLSYQPRTLPAGWIRIASTSTIQFRKWSRREGLTALKEMLKDIKPYGDWIENLPQEPFYQTTGKSKWAQGRLWVEVDLMDREPCQEHLPKSLQRAWLPFRSPRDQRQIISIMSRGC